MSLSLTGGSFDASAAEEKIILESNDASAAEEKIILESDDASAAEEKIILESDDASAAEEKIILESEETCITSSCHDNMGKKKYVHGVGTQNRYCRICHSIVKAGEHRFEMPEKSRVLCDKCHSGRFLPPPGLKATPMEVISRDDVFEEGSKMSLHRPFADGKCTECHDAHESDYYKQLKGSFPDQSYASFSEEEYGLCTGCHKDFKRVLAEPRTLDITNFRNGNLNLHFRHVTKKKGRTCKICHHPHGSDNPKLINDDFLFGKRRLSINYKKSDTGGRCLPSCHFPLSYDRYEPVEIIMIMTPRLGEDATEGELRLSRERDLQKEKEKQEGPEVIEENIDELNEN